MSGVVVDSTNGDATSNFDATKYPAVSGVEVCVYDDAAVPCVATDASGNYTLVRVPSGKPIYVSYTKAGYVPYLYGVTPAAGQTTSALPIFYETTAYTDSWETMGGAKPDPTKGMILFGAVTTAPSASPFHEMFGGAELFYVPGFTVTISPAAIVGPIYTSTNWAPDPSLASSSEAGFGFFQASPGDYTLTFTHPTMSCETVATKVVAGYKTTNVGALCTALSPASGGVDGGSD